MGLAANLVANWQMNDNRADRTVLDALGRYHATASRNTALMATAGKVGGALALNGTTDSIDLGNAFNNVFVADFSVAFSINVANWATDVADEIVILRHTAGTDSFGIHMYPVIVAEEVAGYAFEWHYTANGHSENNSNESEWAEPANNLWYDFVCTMRQNGPTVEGLLYISGEVVALASVPSEPITMSQFNAESNLKVAVTDVFLPFKGKIDNLMIFNKALSVEEVAFLYNNTSESLFGSQGVSTDLMSELLGEDY